MYVWRICQQKHKDRAFSAEGGLYAPARWTPQGFLVVYTAESLALASLEVFVHTESLKITLVAIRAFLPYNTNIKAVDVDSLPTDWQQETAYPSLQNIGKQWLLSNQTPVLKVPSAIIPGEFNIGKYTVMPTQELEEINQGDGYLYYAKRCSGSTLPLFLLW